MPEGIIIPTQLDEGAKLPVYMRDGDVAADLHALTVVRPRRGAPEIVIPLAAFIGGHAVIPPRDYRVFGTGVRIALPPGFRGDIKCRSGLAVFDGLGVEGGVIDANYRGELRVILHNHTDKPVPILPGDRIAQMLITRYALGMFQVVDKLDEDTARGTNAFGSSGMQ